MSDKYTLNPSLREWGWAPTSPGSSLFWRICIRFGWPARHRIRHTAPSPASLQRTHLHSKIQSSHYTKRGIEPRFVYGNRFGTWLCRYSKNCNSLEHSSHSGLFSCAPCDRPRIQGVSDYEFGNTLVVHLNLKAYTLGAAQKTTASESF